MPDKKVTFKTAGNGTAYVYLTIRSYRNKDGKPTSDETAIGKKDPVTGMLIPNRKYLEIFQGSTIADKSPVADGKPALPNRVASYGSSYALMGIAQTIGLKRQLSECFPDKWSQILAAAFYMVCEGNVMMYLDDWFDENDVTFAKRMDDQHCSRLFSGISHEERTRFFKEWIKYRFEQEYIAYDVTSVSTYSNGMDNAEWGYNRDNENIPQVNLSMFYGIKSCLPVFYSMYSGSIPDKGRLAFMMLEAGKLGISNARFVMDCGFVMEDNLRYMQNNEYLFITALPRNFLEMNRIVDSCKNNIRKAANWISGFEVYGLPYDTEIYGIKMKAHVYFDAHKQALDEKELYARIGRLATDLEKMSRTKRATKKYTDYFLIEQEKAGGISFEPDCEKIDERLSRAGFFVLLCNDGSLGSGDALSIYRRKDVIEKNFDQLKNGLDFRRLRTHFNQTADGKMFVGFVALILRSYMLHKVKGSNVTKNLTLEKVLIELRKIKSVTFWDSSRALMPLTKTQKTILEVLELSAQELQNSFV
jgi:transposase